MTTQVDKVGVSEASPWPIPTPTGPSLNIAMHPLWDCQEEDRIREQRIQRSDLGRRDMLCGKLLPKMKADSHAAPLYVHLSRTSHVGIVKYLTTGAVDNGSTCNDKRLTTNVRERERSTDQL